MLKKLLMLPLMAFALVTLTAATVTEDGTDIFEWEIVSENATLPSDDPDEEFLYRTTSDTQPQDFETAIYDSGDHLDVFLSSEGSFGAYFYYNFFDNFGDYSTENKVDLEQSYPGEINEYIHIEIKNYNEISVLGGVDDENTMSSDAPSISTLNTYEMKLSVFEEIGGALSTIVTVGSAVFVSTFDGLWDVFWDADANDGEGALNWIAYVAVLPVGFFLVRWGIRKVLGMIQQRM